MKLPQARTKPLNDATPDLEMSADDMIAVHRWLEMCLEDTIKQARMMKPAAIHTKQTRAQFQLEQIGCTFLRNWIVANLNNIEAQLTAAGVLQPVAEGVEAEGSQEIN